MTSPPCAWPPSRLRGFARAPVYYLMRSREAREACSIMVQGLDKGLFETHVRLMKTIKVSEAKRNFTKVFARAKRGETIILQNGDDYMQLVPCVMPEPIPVRPPGYFAADEETVRVRNTLGEESGPRE
jgi:antitoxin (DNA-binding transcriptional repressor) of toxin-antitoxin stability system